VRVGLPVGGVIRYPEDLATTYGAVSAMRSGMDDRAAFLTSVTGFPRVFRFDFFEIVSLFTF
jgi:hypothetical protein